jgi:hypothetical protein
MLAIGLMGQSVQHPVSAYDHRNVSSAQAALDFCRTIDAPLTPVISTGLQDNRTRPLWHSLVQSPQHPVGVSPLMPAFTT